MSIFAKFGFSLAIIVANLAPGFTVPLNAAANPNSPVIVDSVASDASRTARSQLNSHAAQWGIDPGQFEFVRSVSGLGGMTTDRFVQKISGLEVVGSFAALNISAAGNLLSYNVATSTYSGPTSSVVTQAQAEIKLKRALALAAGVDTSQVTIEKIELVIADSALTPIITSGQKLVWRSTTSISGNLGSMSTTYMEDSSGAIISSLPLVRGITAAPNVCEMQVAPGSAPVAGVVALSNGKFGVNLGSGGASLPLCGINTPGLNAPESQIGITNITRSWDYYQAYLGLDLNDEKFLGNISPSINGDAIPRISAFVDVCATGAIQGEQCPYINAFWVPWASSDCNSKVCSGIFLGATFDHADDVIAHELSHGVTFALAFNAGLANTSETAALSEAISDIIGEAVDQINVDPGEAADPSWMMGENVQSGGFRNMQTPHILKIDKNWKPADSHENSGPINRLAWLLANGGKVGNLQINAIGTTAATPGLCITASECTGITAVSALTLSTLSRIGPTASFFDFGRAMIQTCQDFVKNGTTGFSLATCKNVATALQAQGITSLVITNMTKLKTIKHGKSVTVTAYLKSLTGSAVANQTVYLQQAKKGKWVTIKTGKSVNSNSSGKVIFKVAWNTRNKALNYRIISNSDSGLITGISKTESVRIN